MMSQTVVHESIGEAIGFIRALEAVANGLDPLEFLADLRRWDRSRQDGVGTTEWPGWAAVGIRQPFGRHEPLDERERPVRASRVEILALIDGETPRNDGWTLYRHYGSDGFLLYVGKAKHFYPRQYQHRHSAVWWPEVQRITVERFDDEATCAVAELCAIRDEDPEWNIAGTW